MTDRAILTDILQEANVPKKLNDHKFHKPFQILVLYFDVCNLLEIRGHAWLFI
jgi:hypothetical protein